MPKKFDFISPGISIREVDQSTLRPQATDEGVASFWFTRHFYQIVGRGPNSRETKHRIRESRVEFYTSTTQI